MNPIDCDVLASGGGMAGTVAAIAAARQGARTVLFERHGFLGGAATAGAVGQFVGWETRAGRRVIAGIAEEIVQRLEAMGGSAATAISSCRPAIAWTGSNTTPRS